MLAPEVLDAGRPQTGARYRAYVLVLLVLVYTFNFIDRQILGVLAPAIKAELHLSDTQLGLMGGLAFALFYTGLGIPIGWLADRWSRTWIMTLALTLWSGFSAACGLAGSFTQLFLCRMGVGFGEAGGVAPAYSLISDLFPPRARARALAIYSFGIPLGSAMGVLFGGLIASHVNWRAAFITVGLAGVLLAPLFRLTVKEPQRLKADVPVPMGAALTRLARTPSFWLLSLGAASSSTVSYGLMFWLPSFFLRSFHLTLPQVSFYFGAILLIGGLAGVWAGGWLADRLSMRSRKAYPLIPAVAFALTIPLAVAGGMAPSPMAGFFLFLIPQALGLMWLGPVITAVQHLAPARMRSTASSAFLFINNLIGIGSGTLLFGFLSDVLTRRFGAEALRYSILSGLSLYLLAILFLLLASRTIEKDWVD
ncbi:MAG: transporter [Caulobacteraceae bacterium]|nr:transporter [Caulobacteraceae bacterium]